MGGGGKRERERQTDRQRLTETGGGRGRGERGGKTDRQRWGRKGGGGREGGVASGVGLRERTRRGAERVGVAKLVSEREARTPR